MSFLNRLLLPLQPCEDATAYLLNQLNVKFTRTHLRKSLLEHPDYPSLASITDVLGISYKVASAAFRLNQDQILSEPEISAPFMAHIESSGGGTEFGVVTKLSQNEVRLYDPGSKKSRALSLVDFEKIFKGIILAVEAEGNAGETDYKKHQQEEKRKNALQSLLVFGLPAITIIICLTTVITTPFNNIVHIIAPVLFTLLTLAGCIVGVLLLWHEVDQYNPMLKQICQAGKKVNCAAILNSNAAKIFGFSWSSIGLTYFAGMLIALLVAGITNTSVLQLLSWINILSLSYVAFSIYYQWKVAKQWCMLCLLIQGVLLLQFVTALAGGFHTLQPLQEISPTALGSVLAGLGSAFTVIFLLLPVLEKAKVARIKTIDLQRLKHNPQIFEALLEKQKATALPPSHLGITMGNPNGRFKLIKVCNPYCGPCAKVHPAIEALTENNDEVCLQIIFTATENDTDYRRVPVRHLLAIDAQKNKAQTQKALDDWYINLTRNYDVFSNKYPLNSELYLQDLKIKQMHEWCDATQISYTPTIFLCTNTRQENARAHQLPEMYDIPDLNIFLTV